MLQIVRQLTDAGDGALGRCRFLICDRDHKWSPAVRDLFEESGVQVNRTPFRAPNCNAHAERFVRSVKEECLDRLIPLGERHMERGTRNVEPFKGEACRIPLACRRLRDILHRPLAR